MMSGSTAAVSGGFNIVYIFVGVLCFIIVTLFVDLVRTLSSSESKSVEKFRAEIAQQLIDSRFHADKQMDWKQHLLLFDYHSGRGAFLNFSRWPKFFRTPVTDLEFYPLNHIEGCALVQDDVTVQRCSVAGSHTDAELYGGDRLSGGRLSRIRRLSVQVSLSGAGNAPLTFNLLTSPTYRNEDLFQTAYQRALSVYGEYENIVRNRQNAGKEPPAASSAAVAQAALLQEPARMEVNAQILEQVKSLAQMHRDGILTDEEFNEKKKLYMDRMV